MQHPTAINGTQACAVCKYQRRKCTKNCLLAPFFPANRHKDFLNTRKLFGVRNIIKIIENLTFQQRVIAVKTIIYQSNMRVFDPVGGCYKYILDLHKQIYRYQAELNLVNQQLAICKAQLMFTQPQPAQKQKQVAVGNYGDGQNSEGFNIFDTVRVDDQYSRYLNGGESSSLMCAYDVFDSNPVKVEVEGASNGIPPCKQQVPSDVGTEMKPLSTDIRDEAFCFDLDGNVFQDVGEDIKPLLSFLYDKRDEICCLDSGGSNSQTSDQLVLKERTAESTQHQLKHDLNGAASLFNFTNGKGTDKCA
ncbi:LOB domain-containing protein 6-like [Hibiscus syriacus]|uniref:LOB domain-containing protein 6-like n=1 Tax=Hibiscus syriacus TaxID=106335 RepID=UPI00192167E6|nr:LOB domain-containing protein 6-like [Hibiscus syriacus]